MPDAAPAYRGRFAPSPSGALHFGSLVAALGSFLQARSRAGIWLVRIENIDPPREMPGAASAILRELERLGLHWDGTVSYQRDRQAAHRAALEDLRARGLIYRCRCSRRLVGSGPYPGTCRELGLGRGVTGADRIRVDTASIMFTDLLHGHRRDRLAESCGDFVIWRVEDWPAYHLAVVVDDAAAGITEIVRGGDLLAVTPRQILLQQRLNLPTPGYCHLPLALDADGSKLSKQTLATAIAGVPAPDLLSAALAFLGHRPPAALAGAPVTELLAWAISNWRPALIPRENRRPETVGTA